jgi:hypothetical protein
MADRDKSPPGQKTPDHDAEEIEREAAKSREKLDSVPEPGTDPLHEGP